MTEDIKNFFSFLCSLPKRMVVLLILAYQATLSPDHGWLKEKYPHGYCRFYPSCSEYSRISINKFGLAKGLFLSVARLLRCHPWAEPRVDSVPERF